MPMKKLATGRSMDQSKPTKQSWSRKLTIRSANEDVSLDPNKEYFEERGEAVHRERIQLS